MPEKDQASNIEDFITVPDGINKKELSDSIQKSIADKFSSGVLKQFDVDAIEDMELLPLPDFQEIPNVFEWHLYPEKDKIKAGSPKNLVKKFLYKIGRFMSPVTKVMVKPNLDEMLTAEPSIAQTREYVKLLHNAVNNIIVEFSKLKIEEELLKTKIKVLEDKIEFLENRERAIERKVFY